MPPNQCVWCPIWDESDQQRSFPTSSSFPRTPVNKVFCASRWATFTPLQGPAAKGDLLMAQTSGVARSADCPIALSSLVVVVSELVGHAVGPLEAAEGEGGRHEQV